MYIYAGYPLICAHHIWNIAFNCIVDVLSIIILILYVLSTMSELWWGRTFIVDSGIFLISFLVVLAATWFFRKNKNY